MADGSVLAERRARRPRRRRPNAATWALRVLVVGYLLMLVAWPVALVVRSTFEGGLGNIPADAANAARENVDRAVATAGQLPAEQGNDLLAAARDAFTSGIHVVGVVSAVVYVGLAVLAIKVFKHVKNLNDGGDAPEENEEATGSERESASAKS